MSIFASLRRWVSGSLYRAPLLLGATYLICGAALRVLLWWRFGIEAGVELASLPGILGRGLVNDLVQSVYLLTPFTLLLLFVPRRWQAGLVGRVVAGILLFAFGFGMLFLYACEFFFFDEFDARFNLVAVDYLMYPTEVAINIWDSYPVSGVVAAMAGLTVALVVVIMRRLGRADLEPLRFRERSVALGLHVAAVTLAAGLWSTGTLATADNRVANELAINGVSSFFEALRTNKLDYEAHYRTGDPRRMLNLVRADLAETGGEFTSDDGVTRRFAGEREGFGRLNVVMLVEESFGAEFVGAYGDSRGLTPAFDALSREGLLFEQVYASGTRTVRGLEAITTSFPPIPSESIIKRPGSEGIANLGAVLADQGYRPLFFYGGYGYFDNMNHFFGANGFETIDRSTMPEPRFATIWGMADEELFANVVARLDEATAGSQPILALVMSTSNHKPFEFPEGIPGVVPHGGGRLAGIRYADYAIGRFFEMARTRDWYANTLFVVIADHGARVYGAADIPVATYRIPMLMIAPGHLQPGRVSTLTSQLDVSPTVLGLLGLPYQAPFFGRDVLHYPDGHRSVFFNHNHDVGLMQDGELAVLGLRQQAVTEYVNLATGEMRSAADNAALEDLATAYYQTAYRLFEQHEFR